MFRCFAPWVISVGNMTSQRHIRTISRKEKVPPSYPIVLNGKTFKRPKDFETSRKDSSGINVSMSSIVRRWKVAGRLSNVRQLADFETSNHQATPSSYSTLSGPLARTLTGLPWIDLTESKTSQSQKRISSQHPTLTGFNNKKAPPN